jgi:hypothetical protein
MIATIAVSGATAMADPLPRIEHISRALAAVRALGPSGRDKLDRDLTAAARARCRADAGTPAASCLIAAARAICTAAPERPRCEAAADVIVTNLRAAAAFVDQNARVGLLRGSANYHAALATELRRRYAMLAAELVLAGAGSDLPRSTDERSAAGTTSPAGSAGGEAELPRWIDETCLGRDRAIHACEVGDTACVPSLPWSRCVAALIWFIGGTP